MPRRLNVLVIALCALRGSLVCDAVIVNAAARIHSTQAAPHSSCSEQRPSHVRVPARTWADIAALPSAFNASSPDFAYTAIVSVYTRPDTLERMVAALLAQSHPPEEIVLSCFHSPHEAQYATIIARLRATHPTRIQYVVGSPQLTYYARWQLALNVRTPHVAILDDDMIPGADAMRFTLHMMHVSSREYWGFIAASGHRVPVEARGSSRQFNPILHWATRPYTAQPVDVAAVGMLRSEWVRFVWLEPPLDWTTADDMHVPHTLRMYGGIPAFVAPAVESDPSTWLMSPDVEQLSAAGATTQGDASAALKRIIVSWKLHLRGRLPLRAHEMWGETRGVANVLALLPHAAAAARWQPWWTRVFGPTPARAGGSLTSLCRGLLACLGTRAGGPDEMNAVADALHVNWTFQHRTVGLWDLELAGEPSWVADARLRSLLAAVRPALVLVDAMMMTRAGHAEVVRSALQHARVPSLDVAIVLQQCAAINTIADNVAVRHATCIADAITSALCRCQQPHSNVGAFVRCSPPVALLVQPTFEQARDFGNQSMTEEVVATLV